MDAVIVQISIALRLSSCQIILNLFKRAFKQPERYIDEKYNFRNGDTYTDEEYNFRNGDRIYMFRMTKKANNHTIVKQH